MNHRHGFSAVGLIAAIIVIGIISIPICLIISNNRKSDAILPKTNETVTVTHADMSENLIVDDSTGIVYVSYYYAGELTLAPYYSSRGLLYKYEDGELVEVPK